MHKTLFAISIIILTTLASGKDLSKIETLIKNVGHDKSNTKLISELLKELNTKNMENKTISTDNRVEVKKQKLRFNQLSDADYLNFIQNSANSGNSKAQYILGVIYSNGYGVKQDYKTAKKWYLKAAAQGNNDAKLAIELLNESD